MKEISLTPRAAMPRLADLAKVLTTKALELLTSLRLSIVLGVVAFIAIMSYHITGAHPVRMACITLAWAVQLALYLTLDIKKGGAEL